MKKLTSTDVIKALHCNQNKCFKVHANRTANKAEMLDENIGRFYLASKIHIEITDAKQDMLSNSVIGTSQVEKFQKILKIFEEV